MSFGSDFLKGFFGSDYLKDYTHASKTFRANGYELAPRYKFLFHVYFNLNTDVVGGIPKLREVFDTTDQKNIGLMVKTVQLPNYQLEVETMNQYNRKRLIQKKIDYNPCQFTFHDDGNDLIRNMWYNYFAYYYKDPTQQYWGVPVTQGSMGASGNGGDPKLSYNGRDIYNDDRPVNDWGYVGESYSDGTSSTGGKPPFFRDITIFGLANGPDGHQFCAYVLINPMITEWRHDTYDYSQGGGLMEHQMTVRYETVKYYSGKMNAKNAAGLVTGFAKEDRYDTVPSSLSRPGSSATILGQGGLIDTIGGVVQDLQSGSVLGIVGAIQKAGTAYQTFKGKDLQSIVRNEANAVVKDVIRGELPGAVRQTANAADGFFFPKVPVQNNPTTTDPATPRSATPTIVGPATQQVPR
jgi:hypothetical protein